jgi:hypothetical protein
MGGLAEQFRTASDGFIMMRVAAYMAGGDGVLVNLITLSLL